MIQKLSKWIIINSNGDWEHEHGIKILSTDSPGWSITIDLNDTALSNATYKYDQTEDDGNLMAEIEDSVFKGYCSINRLYDCISLFIDDVVPLHIDRKYQYEVFVEFNYRNTNFWRPALGVLTDELKIKLTHIPELVIEDIKALSIDVLKETSFKDLNDEIRLEIGKEYDFELKELYNGSFPVVIGR